MRGIFGDLRLDAGLAQALSGSRDRKAVGVEQVLDLEQLLDVATRVDALALPRLLRTDRAKLCLPVTEHVRLDADDVGNLTDPVEELYRCFTVVQGSPHSLAVPFSALE